MRTTTPPRAERPRLVVLVILLANLGWVVALPVLLTEPPSPGAYGVLGALLALLAAAYALTLRAAVTPWLEPRARSWSLAALLAVTGALWPVCFAWARPTQEPWAWLAGFAIGVGPLVLSWRGATALGAGIVAGDLAGAVTFDRSVGQHLLITVSVAAAMIGVAQVTVWLLRLLVAAETAQEAEASLAVSQERLRLARDLHDVLGQRLGLIALQAEVAGAEDIRTLATTTLREVRQTVHGYGTVDLAEQLQTARLVLTSAGIKATVRASTVQLAPATSQLAAAVVREGITNVLRHSDARQVWIDLSQTSDRTILLITNDGVRPNSGPPGLGLAGLADRAAQSGAELRAGAQGDRYTVRLEIVPP